ncbi:MAG: LacI family DNA-binding transcriptional regulator [Opitutaceae bacterium]
MAKVSRVTLRDIAEQAGVSRITVSLALRGSSKISIRTRQRIESVARRWTTGPIPSSRRWAATSVPRAGRR